MGENKHYTTKAALENCFKRFVESIVGRSTNILAVISAAFVLFGFVPAWSQSVSNYSFVHIGSEDGLSQSNVKAIIQDSYGFMWFGTKNGLNRYDGRHIELFNCDDESKGRSNHNISALFEDDDRRLWVGTDEGVYIYDIRRDTFEFIDDVAPDGEMMTNWVACIEKDHEGNIWIVVPDKGIFRWSGNRLFHYPSSAFKEQICYLCITDDGGVWVCGWNIGLLRYDAMSDKFVQVAKDSKGRSLLGIETNTISCNGDWIIMAVQSGKLMKYNYKTNILTDIDIVDLSHTFVRCAIAHDNEIWAGTHDGLYVLNEATGEVIHAASNIFEPTSLTDNIVYSLYRDRDGGMWLGTMFGGVNYHPKRAFDFMKFLPQNGKNSLSSGRTREMSYDGNKLLWVGTEDAGFNIINTETQDVTRVAAPASMGSMMTVALYSHGGYTYCCYFKGGMQVIDSYGKSTIYTNAQLGINNSIYSLLVDSRGRLWIGSDDGLYCSQSASKLVFKEVEELSGMWIFDIYETPDGNIWLATMGDGAVKYDPSSRQVVCYRNDLNNPTSIRSNSVSSITQDSKGNLWFSTDRGGICRYNATEDNFTCFSVEDGLPDDVAYKILEDDNGYLWFGTNHGLVKFDPENGNVRVFTTKEGLCSNQFNYKSAEKSKNGLFYFGTIDGIISFNPLDNVDEERDAPIYFTKLLISNEEVTVHSPDSPLKENILETSEINLPYDKANISLNVALLSYSASPSNEYYYMLEPVDKQWVRSNQGGIQYANLAPGKYVLHLSVAGEDGLVKPTPSRSLAIKVSPPWWWSAAAIVCYVVLVVCMFTAWFIWYRRHKNKQLVERQKLFEIEKEKELYESKVEFFTEVAHEIRTPLTLINGPLEIIKEQGEVKDAKLAKNLNVIEQNTKRLLDLATQLLDFQKIGANKLKLKYEKVDISRLLEETVSRFEPTFLHNGKTLSVTRCDVGLVACVDKEAITKILSNLLNNALKYSNNWAKVELACNDGSFEVKVSSDGDKIPANRAEQIFEPFYQLDERTKEKRGVGIGLSLARSLAMAHKGTLLLDIASSASQENTFVLTIPLNMEQGEEVVAQAMSEVATNDMLDSLDSIEEDADKNEDFSEYRILIVEDEPDLLDFICSRLSESFYVERATNGQEAIEVMKQVNVDLIVSDVMMPVMNGIELCKAVKNDLNLCHIPVIFLTAKNDINSKIAGLRTGAEAYIEKPFSFGYLKMQITSLLSNRQKEREAFSKRPFFPVKNMQMSKEDEVFMDKLLKVINDNITDETFNVERLAEELCMSRSSLLRKIKNIFNLPPLDFIRLIKLKKAAELIQEGKYKMGEICYMVGFSSHSYFSKLFSKQFGMSPKDFEKQVQMQREKSRGKQKSTDEVQE